MYTKDAFYKKLFIKVSVYYSIIRACPLYCVGDVNRLDSDSN